MSIITEPAAARPGRHGLSRLKVHLRVLRLAGKTYRVVTLRPGTPAAFSTNYYHQTWHVVSDRHGSELLGRLLWGLAYQKHPGALVLVHGPHLLPTPFEAERSDPFLLLPEHLTPADADAFRALKTQLPHLGPPDHTIRWHTFGLDQTLRGRHDPPNDPLDFKSHKHLWKRETMARLGGFVYYSAPPAVLRRQAAVVHGMRFVTKDPDDSSYYFLAECRQEVGWHWPDGEVQIFQDYRDRVAAAVQARRELGKAPNVPVLSETTQYAISARRDAIKHRRRRNRAVAGARDRRAGTD